MKLALCLYCVLAKIRNTSLVLAFPQLPPLASYLPFHEIKGNWRYPRKCLLPSAPSSSLWSRDAEPASLAPLGFSPRCMQAAAASSPLCLQSASFHPTSLSLSHTHTHRHSLTPSLTHTHRATPHTPATLRPPSPPPLHSPPHPPLTLPGFSLATPTVLQCRLQ